MNRIIFSTLTIVGALALVAAGTGAFFSDTERASGNTFAAGVIDLKVDNESYYNGNLCKDVDPGANEDWRWEGDASYPVPGTPCSTSWELADLSEGHLFFNFLDLKPDDEGEDTISLHVMDNDAWACMNIALTSNDDHSSNELELAAGDAEDVEENLWDGELAQNIEFVWWADGGDNVLEDDEQLLSDDVESLYDLAYADGEFSVALADSENNVWGDVGDPIPGGETVYVGKAWCLGNMELAPVPQGEGKNPSVASGIVCDGTFLDNGLQTDGVTLDVSFLTMQARHDSEYLCPSPEEPPVACELVETYADEVVFVDQGLRKNNTPVTADRSVTAYALGAPQSTGSVYDNPVFANSFFSLGFPLGGNTAEIVLSFNDNVVVDGPDEDLKLWEVTGGSNYPNEKVDVYVGNTIGDWTPVGNDVIRDAEIDIASAGVGSAWRYVRIVDASTISDFSDATADGFDLDAVEALNCIQSPIRD